MILCFNILLLNLIIAILANTYNIFDARSNGLYLSKILISRDELLYDPCYGSFLAAMPPLNAIQLPFIVPALMLRYNSSLLTQINSAVMRMQFFMFTVIFFGLFIVATMALIPFAYLVGVLDKIKTLKTQANN